LALQDDQGGEEEAASGDHHEEDGVAVGGLGRGWRGGGVVAALGAALSMGRGGAKGDGEDYSQENAFSDFLKQGAVLLSIVCLRG